MTRVRLGFLHGESTRPAILFPLFVRPLMPLARLASVLVFVAIAAAYVPAQEPAAPPRRAVLDGVEPMHGLDPTLSALARALRIAGHPDVTDDELFGLTGAAFLATVCSNNCNCREWRELSLRIDPALKVLGVGFERLTNADEAAWERVRASIAGGVPVVLWNVFGDMEDALVTGYDLDADKLWGYGVAERTTAGEASLSAWRANGIHGFRIERREPAALDLRALELSAIDYAVASAMRPPLEGG